MRVRFPTILVLNKADTAGANAGVDGDASGTLEIKFYVNGCYCVEKSIRKLKFFAPLADMLDLNRVSATDRNIERLVARYGDRCVVASAGAEVFLKKCE